MILDNQAGGRWHDRLPEGLRPYWRYDRACSFNCLAIYAERRAASKFRETRAQGGEQHVTGKSDGGLAFRLRGESSTRAHVDPTSVGQATRQRLRAVIHWSLPNSRYGGKATNASDYILDMNMLLHPALAAEIYIDALVKDATLAAQV